MAEPARPPRLEQLRARAIDIFGAALAAADPEQAVLRSLRVEDGTLFAGRRRYRLSKFRRIFVVGAGKAGAPMARAVERLLGPRISDGLVNVKYGHTLKLRSISLNECGHPIPDENGVRGARRIAEIAAQAHEGDLLVCLISGGASALLPAPAPPITLAEKQKTTDLLLRSGASIQELNAVRKHISTLKGGQLARLAAPATVITLILSDVIGDDPGVIGSGPTAPDATTIARAASILTKYHLRAKVPASVWKRIHQAGAETPKALDGVQNLIVGSSRLAVETAAQKARELGYHTMVLSTFVEGEAREVARVLAAIAKEIRANGRPARPPACVIAGGETTVTVRGTGLGGRNQELALAAAIEIAGLKNTLILSAGTDGTDGPTDAAGAIVDGATIKRIGLDARKYLDNNDSYRFLAGELLKTGPTNTNVGDLMLVLVEP